MCRSKVNLVDETMKKPYSEACDQNREPILAVLKSFFASSRAVLEIGSGTGQHAVYFAAHLPHLRWYTSEVAKPHTGIQLWLDEANLPNVHPPLTLDVTQVEWPVSHEVDAVFSANTVHIMHWHEVTAFFSGVGWLLPKHGRFALYGPFNYGNLYTSDSNAAFDKWLKARDRYSGIRNFENLDALANQAGMALYQDVEMPKNNRMLCWEKVD